jgi:hypothetical protein
MVGVRLDRRIVAMVSLSRLQREAARANLAAIAEAVAVDVAPARARRTRWQHLRNGVGAMLTVSSQYRRRRTPLGSLLYLIGG